MADSVQLILDDGDFNRSEFEGFLNSNGASSCGTAYQIVSIMGPQSSGKSTLMNHLFGTRFQEMDALSGRGQTTRGVWLAKSPRLDDITTLVMDLEGNDGRERGEDDTNFERQSALFALAVSDVLLVNIWCHDIGREHGAGKPLMKTILQVNLKLFGQDRQRRKTVLLFVIRDKSKTPLSKLTEVLTEDLQKIWAAVSKPPEYKDSQLQDLFDVQFAGLSHFEERHEDFLADVNFLRRRFSPDDDDTLVVSNNRLPANSLAFSAEQIWQVIRSQKDLNLPAHKVMVANIRCQEIKEEQLKRFEGDQAWESLQQEAGASLVLDFGRRAANLVDSCITGYEVEAMYFDTGVQQAKRAELTQQLQALVAPLEEAQLKLLQDGCVTSFKDQVKRGVEEGGGFTKVMEGAKEGVRRQLREQVQGVALPGKAGVEEDQGRLLEERLETVAREMVSSKIKAVVEQQRKVLESRLSEPVVSLLEEMPEDLWSQLQEVMEQEVGSAAAEAGGQLQGYGLEEGQKEGLQGEIRAFAWKRVEGHVKEAALTRLSRMKDRFHHAFNLNESGTPRTWTARDDITAIARTAREVAVNVLAQLAILRMPDESCAEAEEAVDVAVAQLLANSGSGGSLESRSTSRAVSRSPSLNSRLRSDSGTSTSSNFNIATATSWPGASPEAVLLQPHDLRLTWREFMSASNVIIQQATLTQQANINANRKSLPIWALLAMVVLGFNEMKALLFNPLLLVLGAVAVFFFKTVYQELDVDGELQKGTLPGLISLSGKVAPAMKKVSARTFESAQSFMSANSTGSIEMTDIRRVQQPSTSLGFGEEASNTTHHISGAGMSRRKVAEMEEDSAVSSNSGRFQQYEETEKDA